MGAMDSWDVTLLIVAGYVAIVTLVRLMARRRKAVLEQFRRKAEEEKRKEELQSRIQARRSA
ncbi:MAG: hypothetical protein ACWGMZ_06940 [Thermoguttaceae bacterium]